MRSPLVLVVAAATVAIALPASARPVVPLDGHRRTSHSYEGDITGSNLGAESVRPEEADPTPAECTADACSATEFDLQLPPRRATGRLVAQFTFTDSAVRKAGHRSLVVAIHDAQGRLVAKATPEDPSLGNPDPGDPESAQQAARTRVVMTRQRLEAGRYFVRIYNLGPSVHFEATTLWLANAPAAPRQ